MKKFLTFILATMLLLSLAACSAPTPSKPSPPAFVGSWEMKTTMPDGTVSIQFLTFKEDSSAIYWYSEIQPDGTQQVQDPIVYNWGHEYGEITCVGEDHTIIYLYDATNNTLTDKNNRARIFKPAN